jgi:hypothetical protein
MLLKWRNESDNENYQQNMPEIRAIENLAAKLDELLIG